MKSEDLLTPRELLDYHEKPLDITLESGKAKKYNLILYYDYFEIIMHFQFKLKTNFNMHTAITLQLVSPYLIY